MPVVTDLGANIGYVSSTSKQILITVDNGSGTTGDPALITLTVVWDPSVMSFGNVISPLGRVSNTNSSCTWTDYGIDWGAERKFKLVLFRKNGNVSDTYVIATPTDARSGDSDAQSWPVPTNHPEEP